MVGQYFYGEPVARIVRQINPVVKEGLTTLHNVYQDQKSEFLKSTDPLFRPVDMATAPDGSLYVVDMYHGIIQEGQWTPKGSYLRTKIEQYQLDKVVGLGRIWRITHESKARDLKKPNMYTATPSLLVSYLAHPNGWWRDAAQQELVARKPKSVIPMLTQMALNHKNLYARIQALWTLEGIDGLKTSTISQLMKDSNPKIRIQAMRAGETLVKNGDKSLHENYIALLGDKDDEAAVQAMLSNKFLKIPELEKNIKLTIEKNPIAGIKLVGEQIINPPKPRNMGPFGAPELNKDQKAILERGELIFNELCSQCHGNNGMGKDAGNGKLLAPGLAGNARIQGHPEYAIRVVLHGLEGAIDNKTYTGGLMAPMKDQKDQWIADVVSFIRNGLSNEASFVSPAQVAAIRAKTSSQSTIYKYPQLLKEVPEEISLTPDWKITASHTANTRVGGNISPKTAFTYEGWSTGIGQEKDMYYQIEFPKEISLSEFIFVSPSSIKRGWRPDPKSPPTNIPMITTFPKSYSVMVSKDGQSWETISDQIKGSEGENTVYLQKKKTKFLKLKLNETAAKTPDELPWIMRSAKVYGYR
jgi:mono/diheme cytochrome c family protein